MVTVTVRVAPGARVIAPLGTVKLTPLPAGSTTARLYDCVPPVRFDRVIVPCSALPLPDGTAPNDRLTGSRPTRAFTAAKTSRRPVPTLFASVTTAPPTLS